MATYDDVKNIQIRILSEKKAAEELRDSITENCRTIALEIKKLDKEFAYVKLQYEVAACIAILSGIKTEEVEGYSAISMREKELEANKKDLNAKLEDEKLKARDTKIEIETLANDLVLSLNYVVVIRTAYVNKGEIIVFELEKYKFKEDGNSTMSVEKVEYSKNKNEWFKMNNSTSIKINSDNAWNYIIKTFLKDYIK